MQISLAKARRILTAMTDELHTRRQNPFVELSCFDEDADQILDQRRDSILNKIDSRARALDVLSTLRTKIMQAEMDSGLVHLENELGAADDYMQEAEDLLAAYKSGSERMIPGFFKNMEEARKITLSFPVLNEDSATKLGKQLDRAHEAREDIRERIEATRTTTKITLDEEQTEIVNNLVSIND